ncbi:MAG TPA: ABC transporter permease [Bryobacteraceae bacterium]|nr:ABC transporter permease [Bryobacteraceae bacterium]
MHNLIQDIRYAVRMLRRNPGFTTVAVLALALGIGANTAVFTVVNGVLLQPMPFPEPDRLFLISYSPEHGPFDFGPAMVDSHYLEFRRDDKLFAHTAVFQNGAPNLTGAGDPVKLRTSNVTPDFFAVLRVNPAMGRSFLPEEGQPGRGRVVVLSDKLWRGRFGADQRILGQSIKLDGVNQTVIGVMPAGFNFPDDAEAWRPLALMTDPGNSFLLPVIGRLKPGASPQQAQAELETLSLRFTKHGGEDPSGLAPRIVPLKELLVAHIRLSLRIFAGAVGFVLLIACANVANLLLARAAGRQQEMSVRAALGASRWRLMRQLLTESTLISLAGGAGGVLMALWGVPALLALAPDRKIPRIEQIHIDGWVLAFTIGVSLSAGIAFGLAPAFHAARRELRDTLSQSGRTLTGRHEALRSALVVTEIALALVLLTGAGLMLKSFLRLRAVDPGFRPENVLTMTVDLPESVYHTALEMRTFHQRALAKLSALPGAVAAAAVNFMPLAGPLIMGDFHLEGGRPMPPKYTVDKPCVSPGYFRAMGIRLLRGREFTDRDNAAAPGVVILSQSVARRLWPGEDPLGQQITMEDHPAPKDWLTIIGVVDDVRQQSLSKGADHAIYRPYLQVKYPFFLMHMTFAVRTASDPQQLAPALRKVLHEVDRDQPVESIAPMADLIHANTAEPRFQARLLGAFSLLALILSAVGIYGVLAYAVTQRTHEIGIRMALGAESADVLRMVLRRTLILAAAGIALGTAGALALTRLLSKFLFEVKPTDPATFIVVAALLAGVALLAGAIPARRASNVDPMVALRYE